MVRWMLNYDLECMWNKASVINFLIILSGVRLSPLGTAATIDLLYQPRMIDDDEIGVIGGMKIGRGNRSTRRKPAPMPLCPPQIPHDLTWGRTRAAAVGNQRLTAWAMARPEFVIVSSIYLEGLRKTTKPWGSLCPGLCLNLTHSECSWTLSLMTTCLMYRLQLFLDLCASMSALTLWDGEIPV
jgi:hypothetical protein